MNNLFNAKSLALFALMTALLEAGKLCLSFIANVEVVSLFCAIFGFVFGASSIFSVIAFVLIEIAIWGINSWVISYAIYFPIVTLFFAFFSKNNVDNLLIFIVAIIVLTLFFGLLTSFVDVSISGFNNFFDRFFIYYLRGIVFFVVHVVSNAVIFAVLFIPLKNIFLKVKNKFV